MITRINAIFKLLENIGDVIDNRKLQPVYDKLNSLLKDAIELRAICFELQKKNKNLKQVILAASYKRTW